MIAIGYVIAASASASILIALFNKALTDGARNGAARLAWALAATALGAYVGGAVGGVIHVIERGVVEYGSRSGSVTFHRDEHPLLFWGALGVLSAATCVLAALAAVAAWKALKKS
ncbi:hypothetical protein [Luteibacter yeojuensis]|uniref:Uncharacterized protein n=1 Tax=Luteibacter yeojuensis TaxID=345309 RepID=A0A0F3KRB6_9GAMM|nr:hypothetical protein [Luteibacter yeojuensis]KJV33805.1 hypothetical protein VI08_10610 [Luteibacter yeojuensis]